MMRALIAVALSALATPSLAEDTTWLLPPPGIYCPVGQDLRPIVVGPGPAMGIDGLDCTSVRLQGGRVLADSCYADGGSQVAIDEDLVVTPSGALLHDGVMYRRSSAPAPCPRG